MPRHSCGPWRGCARRECVYRGHILGGRVGTGTTDLVPPTGRDVNRFARPDSNGDLIGEGGTKGGIVLIRCKKWGVCFGWQPDGGKVVATMQTGIDARHRCQVMMRGKQAPRLLTTELEVYVGVPVIVQLLRVSHWSPPQRQWSGLFLVGRPCDTQLRLCRSQTYQLPKRPL